MAPHRRLRVMNAGKICLALGWLGLTACAAAPTREQEVWTNIPGVTSNPDKAMARLAEVLWDEQAKFRLGRLRRFLPPIRRLAVGAIVHFDTARRTLLSQRLEGLLAQHLERVSGLSVFPRREMVRWEEDFLLRKGKTRLSNAPISRKASHVAAELGGADAVILGRYKFVREKVVVGGEFIRLTPALGKRNLVTVSRARISLPLSAFPLSEIIAQMPVHKRDILPKPPRDWVWNPVSVWYEVIKAGGERLKGLDGAVLTPADTYLVSFLAARPIYVMILRLDSGGEVRILFPESAADLSERAAVGRRYSVPDRLTESSLWAAAYVLFSDEPFRYRRDVLPGLHRLLAQVRSGVSKGIARTGIVLPSGIFQRRLWFTQRRDKPRSGKFNSDGREMTASGN